MLKGWIAKQGKNNRSSTALTSIGDKVESLAQQWLDQQGLKLVTRNYRCRGGEIDLVMMDAEQLVFVEVRYRKDNGYATAAASVDWRKQKKLIHAARFFLMEHPDYQNRSCRFDVLATESHSGHYGPQWSWIKNAFSS